MPQTLTHALFTEDIYDKLDNKIKRKLVNEKKSMIMFGQNTDSLMFYNIMNFKKGKKIRSFQSTFHTSNVSLFFENLIDYIKYKNYYNDPKTLAFLYGFISHYSLDGNIHPLIYYKTGEFISNNKETYKYNGLHNDMETYIDNYTIRERIMYKYQNFNVSKFCFHIEKFSPELNDTISYSFDKTFGIKNMDKIYYKSLKHMKKFIYLFRYDRFGIKKIIYKLIDKFTPKKFFILENISYNQKLIDKNNYLNSTHKTWNYPVDKNITSNKSYKDLYNISLTEAIHIISEIDSYFFHDKKININKLFKNRNYATGIDCNSKSIQKYFEF